MSTRWASSWPGTCSSWRSASRDYVLELRGKGLLAGIKITPPVRDFVARLRDDHQLLAMGAGDNVLRLLPPLIVTEADIEEADGQDRRRLRGDRGRGGKAVACPSDRLRVAAACPARQGRPR